MKWMEGSQITSRHEQSKRRIGLLPTVDKRSSALLPPETECHRLRCRRLSLHNPSTRSERKSRMKCGGKHADELSALSLQRRANSPLGWGVEWFSSSLYIHTHPLPPKGVRRRPIIRPCAVLHSRYRSQRKIPLERRDVLSTTSIEFGWILWMFRKQGIRRIPGMHCFPYRNHSVMRFSLSHCLKTYLFPPLH